MTERAFGDYTVLEHLGAGGMSRVDLARRTVEEARWVRLVALKRIRSTGAEPSLVRMFCDEARIGAELHHQNIAEIYDFGREGEELFLVMEYVPGLDLRIVLQTLRDRRQRMPVRVALAVTVGVLAALGYAHARRDPLGSPLGIVHRDVNPRNVMLSLLGEVKLIDFGVALATDRLEQTEAGKVKGKFTYMAPEQLEGRPVDGRADLFAVGLMLTEMVNGRSPFVGLTEMQAVHRIVAGKIPGLDGVDEAILGIQRRALALTPEERYPHARAFADDVVAAAAKAGGLATEEEIGDFVRSIDPDGVRRVEARIRAWRAGLGAPVEATEATRTLSTTGGPTRTRAELRSGLPWWAVPLLGGAVLIGASAVAGGGWAWWASHRRAPMPPPQSAPVVTLASPVTRSIPPDTPGSINVYTEPDGLAVYLDDAFMGTSPLVDLACPPGEHAVEVRDRRGRKAQESVRIEPGAWATVQLTLR